MPDLIVLRGLPRSGKTPRAFNILKSKMNTIRLNQDDLRACFLGNLPYDPLQDHVVLQIESIICKHLLELGKNVVIDDLNLNPKHLERYQKIAQICKAEMSTITVSTSAAECVRRDAATTFPLGEDVIKGLAKTYNFGDIEQNDEFKVYFLEGVLSNVSERYQNTYGQGFFMQGEKCNANLIKLDKPIKKYIDRLNNDISMGFRILIISEYPVSFRTEVNEWMFKNNVMCNTLILRDTLLQSKSDFKLKMLKRLDLELCKGVIASFTDFPKVKEIFPQTEEAKLD